MQLSALLYSGLIILQIISMNMLFTDYATDSHNKFEEKRLQIAVNYATDAAAEEMRKNSDNLNQDYIDITKFNVDPKIAMDTFAAVLGKNYNVPLSDENIQSLLTDYVPVLMVASYDGYYVLEKTKIDSAGQRNMVFTPKMPYSSTYIEYDGTKSIYSYNLSHTSALKVAAYGGMYRVDNPPLSKDEQSDLINNKISDVFNEALAKGANVERRGMIYIPSKMTTIRATNSIKETTILAYIDNFDLAGYGMNLHSFGIGGSDIKPKRTIVGFETTVGGVLGKYYYYADELPVGVDVAEIFDSAEEAAGKGYYYYIK